MTGGTNTPPPDAGGEKRGGEAEIRDLFGLREDARDLALSRLPRNDIGNAKRLIRRFGQDLIWVKDLGWHVWCGTHWDHEHGEREAQQKAHDVARLIMDEALAAEAEGRMVEREDGKPEETAKEFRERIDGVRRWSTASGNMPRIKGMLEAAAPDLARDRRQLDADPWAFNLLNGTLDLQPDGLAVLRKHRRADLITRAAPVAYDPDARCPGFARFLEFILPDPQDGEAVPVDGAMRGLVQRFFGYALTGSTALQVAPLFCGTGANGKSTLINVVRGIMGQYAQTLPVEALLENDRKGGGDASPDTARLPGVRLAAASEPEKKARLSTAKLKQFTGGEPIAARQLYGEFFEFTPNFKLILSFNDRPTVPAQDDGTWRRLLLVMFERKIPEDQRRERFELELLTEAPGILNWMLAGYAAWRRQGIGVPEGVRAATEDYRSDNDPLGQFLQDCFEKEPIQYASERAADLFAAYEAWCEDAAADPITKRSFGLRLRDKGFKKGHSNGTVYLDLQLSEHWREQARARLAGRERRRKGGGDAEQGGGSPGSGMGPL